MYQTVIGTDIIQAKHLLETGALVAIPTETVYGLAGNALDPNAVANIYEVKNRPQFNPLILHLSSLEQMKMYVQEIPDECRKFLLQQEVKELPSEYPTIL